MASPMSPRYWRNMAVLGAALGACWLVWQAVKGWFGW
jgi:hypothetical protein